MLLPPLPPLILFLVRESPVNAAVVALAFSSDDTAISKLNIVENNGSKFALGLTEMGMMLMRGG